MFLLIDNYDSFTYNLYHFLGELGARLTVKRNDALTVAEALARTIRTRYGRLAVAVTPAP